MAWSFSCSNRLDKKVVYVSFSFDLLCGLLQEHRYYYSNKLFIVNTLYNIIRDFFRFTEVPTLKIKDLWVQ